MDKFRSHRLQAGMSLIEVLVSLVIFAFGLLGAAGLQVATLRANQAAGSSAVATQLAREYGEMTQMFTGTISSASATTPFLMPDSRTVTSGSASACSGASVTCNPNQLLEAAQRDWALKVSNSLPNGRAEVCRDSEQRDIASGAMTWGNCNGEGDLLLVKVGWTNKAETGETINATDQPKVAVSLTGNVRNPAAP